ncbi:hypothetical protein ACRQ5Q_41620 (plasmid) [Bradyrhizobium sp. PMVTL-01]|uniref:hypothetical protein n=1 Tax=Bradyrhizobium sp. PMVTL-01 TaxID=3434999 RepID=UPI003F6EFCE8
MALLLIGFGLIAHGLGNWFSPPADSFERAAFIAGSALATVGLSGIEAYGPAHWVLVAAGICGLAVLTMAATYLIEVQEGISRRDRGVLKITTTSGQPPSALGMLERYADLDVPEEIRRTLYWCASVLQSHASHPSLIYFRSVGTGAGWPGALGTMMDLALIFELLIDDPKSRAAAVLLRDEGLRLVGEIAGLIGLEPRSARPTTSEVDAVCRRLSAAGYTLKSDPTLGPSRRDGQSTPAASRRSPPISARRQRRCCLHPCASQAKLNMSESQTRSIRVTMELSRTGRPCSTRQPPRFCAPVPCWPLHPHRPCFAPRKDGARPAHVQRHAAQRTRSRSPALSSPFTPTTTIPTPRASDCSNLRGSCAY